MTWNTRALLSPDERLFAMKWSTIARGLRTVDVLCAQETHGSDDALRLLAARSEASHYAGWSACAGCDSGGVMTWARRSACVAPPVHEVLCPGRILATAFTLQSGRRIVVANIHNFEVPREAILRLAGRIQRDSISGSGTWILQGDWNFSEPEGCRIRVGARGVAQTSRDNAERRRWRGVLRHVVELQHNGETRIAGDASDDRGRRGPVVA